MKLCRGMALLRIYDLGEEPEVFGDAAFEIRGNYPVALAEIHYVRDGGIADL